MQSPRGSWWTLRQWEGALGSPFTNIFAFERIEFNVFELNHRVDSVAARRPATRRTAPSRKMTLNSPSHSKSSHRDLLQSVRQWRIATSAGCIPSLLSARTNSNSARVSTKALKSTRLVCTLKVVNVEKLNTIASYSTSVTFPFSPPIQLPSCSASSASRPRRSTPPQA
jgi:hypothetical protein